VNDVFSIVRADKFEPLEDVVKKLRDTYPFIYNNLATFNLTLHRIRLMVKFGYLISNSMLEIKLSPDVTIVNDM
jgi:hypothetical protein